MALRVTAGFPNTMAFGGVATGSMKPIDALSATGSIKATGSTPRAVATAPAIGRKMAASGHRDPWPREDQPVVRGRESECREFTLGKGNFYERGALTLGDKRRSPCRYGREVSKSFNARS